jgi:lysophospholipase L1-like esterase
MTPAPSDALPVNRLRRPLSRSHRALAAGRLTVGFLGGSITAPKTGTRWPEAWIDWLGRRHPQIRPVVENAALGATGSDLAVFRAKEEIVDRGCDLVFVEYSVNDYDQPAVRRGRTREGLLRQLLAAGTDVVLVHTFRPEMLPDFEAGGAPASIAEFERLADHYNLGSVQAGLHAWRQVVAGCLTWDEWLPDGLHPEQRGSRVYAESIAAFCAASWERAASASDESVSPLPAALDPKCWENVHLLPLEAMACHGPWTLRRWFRCAGMSRALHTSATGAGLRIAFEGRGLVLGFDFGRSSGEVRFRVDDGDWTTTRRDRPAWCDDCGWYRPTVIADDLRAGPHVLELETLPARTNDVLGTTTTIGLVGAIR